jgi:hypothetical protein
MSALFPETIAILLSLFSLALPRCGFACWMISIPSLAPFFSRCGLLVSQRFFLDSEPIGLTFARLGRCDSIDRSKWNEMERE